MGPGGVRGRKEGRFRGGDTLHYLNLFKPEEQEAVAALFNKNKRVLIDF